MTTGGDVGRGALAVALGQARAESGLPITMEQAVRRSVGFQELITDPYAVRSMGVADAWNRATTLYAAQMRGVAADMGSNLSEIGEGYARLQSAFAVPGSDLAARAQRLGDSLGADSDTARNLYAMVYTGELLYKSGAISAALNAISPATGPLIEGMKELGAEFLASLGLDGAGVSGAAAGAACSAVMSTLTQAWNLFQEQTYAKPPAIPSFEYWGKIVCALYGGWDPIDDAGVGRNPASGADFGFAGTAAYPINPSWYRLADEYLPVEDPILRETRVLLTASDKSLRVLDRWNRESLRHLRVKRWLKVDNGIGIKGLNVQRRRSVAIDTTVGFVSGFTEGDLTETDLVGTLDNCSGNMLDPSIWRPVEAHRMNGYEAVYRCAHCGKHVHWCDGTSRTNNICHFVSAEMQAWYAIDRCYLFGGYVAAAYLGANIQGAQNYGQWETGDCGWGSGTYVPGEFWDLGLGGGVKPDGTAWSNWCAMVLRSGNVLLRPPQSFASEAELQSAMGDGHRPGFMRDPPGPWYPMFPMTDEDRADGKLRESGLLSKITTGRIPLDVEFGIAQPSPRVPLRVYRVIPSIRPVVQPAAPSSGVSTGTKLLIGGGVVGAVAAGLKYLKVW
jgi:hypothetical protein